MSGKDRGGDKRSLGLVLPSEDGAGSGVDGRDLEATVQALVAVHQSGESESRDGSAAIDSADHEVLIALTLGEEAASISDREQERAAALRDALEGHRTDPLAELAEALRLAHRSAGGRVGARDWSAVDHETLISLATGVPLGASVGAAERDQAEALRVALDDEGHEPLAELAEALKRAAGQGGELDELSYERVLRQAMKRGGSQQEREREGSLATRRAAPGGRMVVASILALAAGVALFFGSLSWLETGGANPVAERVQLPPSASAALVLTRSTQELFDPATPFPSKGGESDRLAKIVASRATDLRANRFAAWGVR